MTSGQQAKSSRAARGIVIVGVVFALLFPTSVGGVISPTLDRVAILLNVAVFGALLLLGKCHGSRLLAIVNLAMIAWLSAMTLLFPHARLAPGLVAIFVGLALMLSTSVRRVSAPQATALTLAFINLFAFTLGTALAFDVQWADRFVKAYYTAFWQDILVSMLDWYDKPVLTFATHSLAGFFYYLFFYLNFRNYVVTGSRWGLAAAIGHMTLGMALRSTTGWILMTIAGGQLLLAVWRRHGRQLAWVPVLAPLLIVGAVVLEMERLTAAVEPVREMLVGTEVSGLMARYSESGLLAGNLRYLRDSTFSPLGFNYGLDQDLYYSDSGWIQYMLRGSLPLVLLIYGGLYAFLRANLKSRSDIRWLYFVILLFEVGYTPFFRFRFTSFLPFMVVYLNDLVTSRSPEERVEGDA
ncbi:MAG: hypothetical protein GEV06_04080 [Luteitalea sp.]|nr:hypothetical protein [Luteitalea sp.]